MSNASLLLLSSAALVMSAKPPFVPTRVYKDWIALNSRSTTRHLMRAPTPVGREECIAIKTQILAAQASGTFVVDAFSAAAVEHSLDEESRSAGGLLGRRLRQGVVRDATLDRACFCAPLGRVTGPLQTDVGYHLVLVEERIGLERYDEGMSRVVAESRAEGDAGVRSVLAAADPDDVPEMFEPGVLINVAGFLIVSYVGGQLLSAWASSLDLS